MKNFNDRFRLVQKRRSLLVAIAVILMLVWPCMALAFDWLKAGKDLFSDSSSQETTVNTLSNSDISLGLQEALRVGTERVVSQLGQVDGFSADDLIHIPLPENLQKVRSVLETVGMSSMMDDLELKLNRAAEQATPQAKALFWQSIEEMTIDDVQRIYSGAENSATQYFQEKMSQPLAAAMQPLISKSMSEVGAISAYDAAIGQYRSIPFVPDVKADLTAYVVEKGMDGIFFYLGKEEAAIRKDPVKRTTEILQKVFGAK
ncbi:Protein of unknown function [Desulfuromusa kysingii]|uniref:DUF4197 domain-containing protein n=1 Tax=Desulfuromusa kysingii TaxID=37625 RepID=A0A1H4C9L8_9BACT|nr:DUF4197 domain-containing protein [Desulfuromusa kysingii]SEA56782.1 Protein of unknown function [Desulfuromusa kysingii]